MELGFELGLGLWMWMRLGLVLGLGLGFRVSVRVGVGSRVRVRVRFGVAVISLLNETSTHSCPVAVGHSGSVLSNPSMFTSVLHYVRSWLLSDPRHVPRASTPYQAN